MPCREVDEEVGGGELTFRPPAAALTFAETSCKASTRAFARVGSTFISSLIFVARSRIGFPPGCLVQFNLHVRRHKFDSGGRSVRSGEDAGGIRKIPQFLDPITKIGLGRRGLRR